MARGDVLDEHVAATIGAHEPELQARRGGIDGQGRGQVVPLPGSE